MKTQPTKTTLVGIIVISAITLWFIFALVMSLQGHFQGGLASPPLPMGLSILVPFSLFVLSYWRIDSFRAFARALDLRMIVALHISRIIGLDFVIRHLQGQLPAAFAYPAGLGDALIALTAVPLLLAMSAKTPSVRKWFVAWNILGIIDLVLAVALGILHSVSSFGILAGSGPTTLLMTQFPRSLVPTFLVPIFILLHLLALARRNEVASNPTTTNFQGATA
ncbi:MAG: hypothetical protein JWR26_4371 [Pedosphaera sp.]|nr:hypothetical protein [Pedosphaera sp.]